MANVRRKCWRYGTYYPSYTQCSCFIYTKPRIPSRQKLGLAELILLTNPDAGEDGIGPAQLPELSFGDFCVIEAQLRTIMIDIYTEEQAFLYYKFSYILNRTQENIVPKAIVMHDKRIDAYDLKFEADKQFRNSWEAIKGVIAILKATVPVSDRTYEPNTKTWTVTSKYYGPIKELMQELRFTIEESKDNREDFFYDSTPTPVIISKDSLQVKLKAILEVDDDIFSDTDKLKKAYRKKAMSLHPDRPDGNAAAMSELNSLWSAYNL